MKGWRYVPLFEYFTEQVANYFELLSCWRLTISSLKIKLSAFLLIPTLQMPMEQASFIRPPRSVKMITVLPSRMEFFGQMKCRLVPSMIKGTSLHKFLILLVST